MTRLVRLALRVTVMTAVALTPLVFQLKNYEVFNTVKRGTILTFAGVALPLLFLSRLPIPRRAWLPAALLIGAGLLALPGAILVVASVERLALLGAIAVMTMAVAAGAVSVRRLLAAAAASHGLVVGYGALQYFELTGLIGWLGLDIGWTSFGPRMPYSTLGNPAFLGWSCAFMLPILAALGATGRRPWLRGVWWTIAGLSVLGLIYARSSIAFTGAAVAALVAAYGWPSTGPRVRTAALVVLGLAVAGVISLSGTPMARRESVVSHSLNRLFYWHSALDAATASPVLGRGAGTTAFTGPASQGRVWRTWQRVRPEWAAVAKPHLEIYLRNDALQWLADHGIIGLGWLLWIGIAGHRWARIAARRAARRRSGAAALIAALRGSLAGLAAISLVDYPLHVPASLLLGFVVGIGSLLALSFDRVRTRARRREPRMPLVAAAAAVALLCGAQAAQWNLASRSLKLGQQANNAGSPGGSLVLGRTLKFRAEYLDRVLVPYYLGTGFERGYRPDPAAAHEAYSRALVLFPDFPEALLARARVRDRLALRAEALADRAHLLELWPDHAESLARVKSRR